MTRYPISAQPVVSGAILVLGLLVGLGLWQPATLHAAPINAACTTTPECDAGLICNNTSGTNKYCDHLNISYAGQETRSDRIYTYIYQNSTGASSNITVYSCLSSTAICGTQPVTNAQYWTAQGSGTAPWMQYAGLKPGRGYTMNVRGVENGATAEIDTPVFITWPGYKPSTVNVTNPMPDGATLTWTTDTPGVDTVPSVSRVWYSTIPPMWADDGNQLAASETVTDISARADKRAWAGSSTGKIYSWDGSAWSSALFTDASGRAINQLDAVNPVLQAAVTARGATTPQLITSTDGATWTPRTPTIPITGELYALAVTRSNEVWMGGWGEGIYRYTNGVWENHTPTGANPAHSIFSITSLNGIEIWATGSAGRIWHTKDAGVTWTSVVPPTATGVYINAVSTLDGKNIWAAGRNGKIWRSTDSGVTYNVLDLPTSVAVSKIVQTRPDEAIFVQGTAIGRIGLTGGATFIEDLSGNFGTPVSAFDLATPTTWFAANGKTILRYALDTVNAVVDPDTVVDYHSPAPYVHILTLTGLPQLPPGNPYYYAVETTAGGYSTGAFGTLMLAPPDTSPPHISFSKPNPSPALVNTTSYRLEGSADDDLSLRTIQCADRTTGLENYTSVSSTTPTLPINGSNVTATWNNQITLGPADGLYRYTCQAYDGTNTTGADVQIILDRTNPTLAVTSPNIAANAQVIGAVTLAGTVSDANGVNHLDYQLNGGAPRPFAAPVGAATGWSITIPDPLSGSNTIVVHAFDQAGNVTSVSGSFVYLDPTFTLDANPASPQTVDLGQTVTYAINTTPLNGFSGAVDLTVATPAGLSGTISPATVSSPYAAATLTVNTSGGQISTPYTITVTGRSGAKTATATVTLTLRTAPNYTLSIAPNAPMPNAMPGDSGSYVVSLQANSVYSGTVTMSFGALPANVTARFTRGGVAANQITLTPDVLDKNTLFEIQTAATTPPGTYTIPLTANDGTTTKNQSVTLIVANPPDFTFQPSPASQDIAAGGADVIFLATLTSVYNFNGLVTITADTGGQTQILPSPATTSVQVSPGVPGSYILRVHVANSMPAGTYTITLRTQSSAPAQNKPVSLVVSEDSTAPVISNITASPNWDNVTIDWDTNEITDGSIVVWTPDNSWSKGGGDTAVCSSAPCHHSVNLAGLSGSTLYNFSVTSHDISPRRNVTTVMTKLDGTPWQFQTPAQPDTVIPELTVTNPAVSAAPPSVIGTITLTGTATDNNTVALIRVDVQQDGGPKSHTDSKTCAAASCDFSFDLVTDASYTNGAYTLTFVAKDNTGNNSQPVIRHIMIDNNFEVPQIVAGPDVQIADTCTTGGDCSATITWTTNQPSTSEVNYGTTVTYDQANNIWQYPLGPLYDVRASGDRNRLLTTHEVFLPNLTPKIIYHYQITSCNGNRICAY